LLLLTREPSAYIVNESPVLDIKTDLLNWRSLFLLLDLCLSLSTRESSELLVSEFKEAEYVAATEACKELLWLKRFLQELGFKQQGYAVLCDNQKMPLKMVCLNLIKFIRMIMLTKAVEDDMLTKAVARDDMFELNIDIRYHWIRDAIEDDMLTKAVAREKLKICCSFAGMTNSSS
ncbi:hypothetical protein Tco_0021322, partial [Tanacetum coccineum]